MNEWIQTDITRRRTINVVFLFIVDIICTTTTMMMIVKKCSMISRKYEENWKKRLLNNPKWEEKLYRISYNFSSLSFVALKWKGKLKKNFFMKLALLALCAMLFMMTTAQWCYETSLEWVFFSTIYLPRLDIFGKLLRNI